MKKQRVDEWVNPDPGEIDSYFLKQWDTTYRSTILFCKWLNYNGYGLLENPNFNRVCDLGCGAGSNTYYLHKNFPKLKVQGIDVSPTLIKLAKQQVKKRQANIKYSQGDLYNLPIGYKNKFDGIILFQTLSWLPEYKQAIKKIINLNPKYIAFSCLLNDSLVESEIHIKDFSRTEHGEYQEKFYNIYSIEKIKQLFNQHNYTFYCEPFKIDIDIPRNPNNKGMTTYTQTLANKERAQISGGLLLPWHFALAIRNRPPRSK